MAVSVSEFEKALKTLEEAIAFSKRPLDPIASKIARDACIQRFEFCIELAWRSAAKVLGSTSTTAKPVVREMAQNNLIADVDLWFDFIEARNKTSHSYDETIANEVFAALVLFLPEGFSLHTKLKSK